MVEGAFDNTLDTTNEEIVDRRRRPRSRDGYDV